MALSLNMTQNERLQHINKAAKLTDQICRKGEREWSSDVYNWVWDRVFLKCMDELAKCRGLLTDGIFARLMQDAIAHAKKLTVINASKIA